MFWAVPARGFLHDARWVRGHPSDRLVDDMAERSGAHSTGSRRTSGAPRSVCLMTEGTYPHYEGGVSVWCDQLVDGLAEVPFVIDAISTTGTEPMVWPVTPNTVQRRAVPLWRSLDDPRPAVRVDHGARRVVDDLLAACVGRCPRSELLGTFRATHALAQQGRLGPALLSQTAIQLLLDHLGRRDPGRPLGVDALPSPTVADAVAALRNLEHLTRPLAAPPFEARLSHTAANGLSVLLAMSANFQFGTPLLLTEHGMYLRERFLATPPSSMPHHQRVVGLGFLQSLTTVAYELATAIAPGSGFNRGWELVSGADDHKILPIHNGVDHEMFWPPAVTGDPTTLVWVGRLDPLKDVKTLLRSFAIVAGKRPDVRLRIFGGTPKGNEPYVRECKALHESLGLGDRAVFEGRVPSIVEAYHAGNVVVSTSISEGFPYSVLEAMASGRAVVATDVGGVAEAVGDAGLMVTPGSADDIATACLALLGNRRRTAMLGKRARRRVAADFTLQLCLERYRELYAAIDDGSFDELSFRPSAVRAAPTLEVVA